MAKALTALTVEKIKPNPDKRCEIPDPALSGLYLVVQPSGVKSFALRYRFAGKPKKLTLGRWPTMTLGAARAAATDALDEIERGRDPATARKSRRSLAIAAQEDGPGSDPSARRTVRPAASGAFEKWCAGSTVS